MTPPHYNEAFDEYARALLAQNNGMPCTHCGSSLGHRSTCALLNRDAARAGQYTADCRAYHSSP